jgi:ATP-binding cassette subfamily B protein RaxB
MVNRLAFAWGKKTPLILQQQNTECGPACIAMVCSYHGLQLDMVSIRQQCLLHNLSLQGMNLLQLNQLAALNKLTPRAVQCEVEELAQLPLPCVLHWDMQHFVVLTKLSGRGKNVVFQINDPAGGTRQLTSIQLSKHFTGIALTLIPSIDFVRNNVTQPVRIRDLWQRAPGLMGALWQLGALSLVLQLLALTTPYYMQWIMDEVLLTYDVQLLLVLAIGFSGVLLFSTLIGLLRSWLVVRCTNFLALSLGSGVLRHLLRLPHDFFVQRHLGDIASRFDSVHAINERISSGITETAIDGVMALSILIVMCFYGWELTFTVLGFMCVYGILRWLFYQPLQTATHAQLETKAKADSVFLESVRTNQTLTLFNQTDARHQQWQHKYVDSLNTGIVLSRWNISFDAVNKLLFGIENIIVIVLATHMVMAQTITLGMLIAFIAYKNMFTGRIASLIEHLILFKMLGMHMQRLSDITHTPIQPHLEAKRALVMTQQTGTGGTLTLENVTFNYPGSSLNILENVNLQINAGDSLVLSGPSGGGKTTLLKIMLGLLTPTSGQIKYNGMDITDIGLIAYRKQISTVMQDDVLLAGTVLDNITFFAENIDTERVQNVIKQCQLQTVIAQLPMGLQSLVGELGAQLSGGQIQRILLARALYQQPQILFLDEATSALDQPNEALIVQSLADLSITKIHIAHRQETIAHAQIHYEISMDGLHLMNKT